MAMARDGLLPPLFSAVNQRTQIPIVSTILTGTFAAVLALLMDVSQLAGMVSVGTLLAFTAVAISVLVVRYAPPNEMPMEVALEETPESLTSYSADSHQDENSADPLNVYHGHRPILYIVNESENQVLVEEAPIASVDVSKERRQKAMRSILLICIGAIVFISAASLSFLPFYLRCFMCALGGLLLLSSSIKLVCIGQDKSCLQEIGGFMCPWVPFLPVCCIVVNIYLLMSIRSDTWIRVSVWLVAGAPIYLFYGRKHSSLASMAYQRVSPA